MGKKLSQVLEETGLPLDFEACGEAPEEVLDREVRREPGPRAKRLRDLYYQTLSSATNEFPYWYTRTYMTLDSEVPVVRRALALKSAFAHLTPTIFPGELLVMGKAHYYRGSFPMPWLSEGYYMAKEDELYRAALDKGSASADEVSQFGAGGGNVDPQLRQCGVHRRQVRHPAGGGAGPARTWPGPGSASRWTTWATSTNRWSPATRSKRPS